MVLTTYLIFEWLMVECEDGQNTEKLVYKQEHEKKQHRDKET